LTTLGRRVWHGLPGGQRAVHTYDTLISCCPAGRTGQHDGTPPDRCAPRWTNPCYTELADYPDGVPFRQAHNLAGQAVRLAEEKRVKLSELPPEDYQTISEHFDANVYRVLNFDAAATRRSAFGGTAPEAVRVQIAQLKARLGETEPGA
jgi:hypothetical protein